MENTALSAALNTQFLFQIGIFTAVPMILGCVLELGFLRVRLGFVCVFSVGFPSFKYISLLYIPSLPLAYLYS